MVRIENHKLGFDRRIHAVDFGIDAVCLHKRRNFGRCDIRHIDVQNAYAIGQIPRTDVDFVKMRRRFNAAIGAAARCSHLIANAFALYTCSQTIDGVAFDTNILNAICLCTIAVRQTLDAFSSGCTKTNIAGVLFAARYAMIVAANRCS